MTLDAQLPPNPAIESGAPAPLWATLRGWWAPAAQAHADTELGYECALPWTLDEQAAGEIRPLPY